PNHSLVRHHKALFHCAANLAVTHFIPSLTGRKSRRPEPKSAKFPVNFPVSREFGTETGSHRTASSATQSVSEGAGTSERARFYIDLATELDRHAGQLSGVRRGRLSSPAAPRLSPRYFSLPPASPYSTVV